ncbi:MAG: N-6 DNA methylase [Microcystis aeruginosa W13-11]|nr:N-6 DNA methylase [Microcystis aeruginosa W13-11]
MIVNKRELKQALNRVYLKIKPDTEIIQVFQANLTRLLEQCDSKKSEEFNKNLLIDFLKNTYYTDRYFINTKERIDLVIHNNQDVKSPVGVILETKKPTRTINAEMPRLDNLNTKAFQQLVLYFLRERVTDKNLEIKHLIVTNIYEWFIFDGKIFEELFFANKALVNQFCDFEEGRLSSTKTDFFYQQIAEPAITKVIEQIKFTHFDLRELENLDLLDIYKILSPEHLLKLPFVNDSNTLNKPFYNELLYIIGLTEVKDKGKKLIGRMKECDRCDGSLIENAISRLDSLDKIAQLKNPEEFGTTDEERLFNVALRLSINWINRVLFLKLLEAQLIKYHQGDRDFAFLNLAKVPSYNDLDSLFFDVLAGETNKREAKVKTTFAHVPYLNSSLFVPTETEDQTIVIGNLQERTLPIFAGTVLKDNQGNKRVGELNALAYLFEFLDAYKFDRDELENPQEDSEKLINASVLGLIFEKINGYKDGSFYTPSFITMYMCRETIRRAIVQKFNEVKGWNCQTLDDLYERIEDKKEANTIINSLKICDPAVGSGHFLVSALNEIIAIKSELRVLLDSSGKSLKDYRVEVRNDKLLVYDDEGNLFAYHPHNKEKQRVQQALFHEKQTIIEGCLFGVDINPNSVTICRLRLWIELLKNAYYREDGNLETLPNIDINIKCGNSLISRFGLDVDVKQVLQKQKFSIEQYRNAVQTYRNAENKEQKRQMETLIDKIKAGFSANLLIGDPKKVKLRQLQGELYNLENQGLLFEETKTEQKAREKKVTKLNSEIDKLTAEIADIESGRLYDNALEWRFEFPEVLNDDGDFVGFDVVIGNPPWGVNLNETEKRTLNDQFSPIVASKTKDTYLYFFMVSKNIVKEQSFISLIIPNTWTLINNAKEFRKFLLENKILEIVDYGDGIFEEATVESCSIILQLIDDNNTKIKTTKYLKGKKKTNLISKKIWINDKFCRVIIGFDIKAINLINKIELQGVLFEECCEIIWGIKPYQTGYGSPKQTKEMIKNRIYHSHTPIDETWKPLLVGSNINSYSIDTRNIQYIKYGKNLMYSSSQIKMESPKILIRQTSDKIRGCYDDEKFYCQNSIFIITSQSINLKYLLALLNSKLLNFYYMNKNPQEGKIFAEIKPSVIEQIPLVVANNTINCKYIVFLVDKILTAKKDDPTADTSELEKQIDHLVYKLYQLTYNEVKIIDPEFELTEQEYLDLP